MCPITMWIPPPSPHMHTPTSNSRTPAGGSIVHLNSDTVSPETSDSSGKGLSTIRLPPTSDANCKPMFLTNQLWMGVSKEPLLGFN